MPWPCPTPIHLPGLLGDPTLLPGFVPVSGAAVAYGASRPAVAAKIRFASSSILSLPAISPATAGIRSTVYHRFRQ
jgi:hypothetical protein